jgi:hypothetical protein
VQALARTGSTTEEFRVEYVYSTQRHFEATAQRFGLMDDWKVRAGCGWEG